MGARLQHNGNMCLPCTASQGQFLAQGKQRKEWKQGLWLLHTEHPFPRTVSLPRALPVLLRATRRCTTERGPRGPSACSCCLSTAESLSTWLVPCWADQRKASFQMGNRQCQKLNVQRHWHIRHNYQIFKKKKKLWHILKLNLFLYCVFVQCHS